MLITLSPAKLMDFEPIELILEASEPCFLTESDELMDELRRMSLDELSHLMNINPKQVVEVYQYIHGFNSSRVACKQALFTYSGIAYQGLDATSLLPQDITFAQNHLLIFSGLYGVLRPLDCIQPYRLEMQARMNNRKGKTLYDFWSETLTSFFIENLEKTGNVWVDLMSTEYSKVINRKRLPKGVRIITPIFKEESAKGYRQVVVYTKKARGLMARFALQHQIEDPEYLKAFDLEGYSFSEQLSTTKEWVFVR